MCDAATVDSILRQLRDVPDSVKAETCRSVIRKLDYFLPNLNFLYCMSHSNLITIVMEKMALFFSIKHHLVVSQGIAQC